MQVSLTALVGLTIAACGSSSRQVDTAALATGQQTYGETTSEQAVRTFFDAAAADDYPRMWSVFGTRDGPAVERFGIQEIEPRMIVLAGLLRNRGYQMRVANLASYGPERVRYMVQLRDTRNGTVNLPVLTVPDRKGLWFVEQLDMDRMTPGSFP
jgi:hypothetical protein